MKKLTEKTILTNTIEECAEVIQAITKIQRFGKEGENNIIHLMREVGQLEYMLHHMIIYSSPEARQARMDGYYEKEKYLNQLSK